MPKIQAKYPTVSASYEGQNREAFKLINSLLFSRNSNPYTYIYHYSFHFLEAFLNQYFYFLMPVSLIGVSLGTLIHGFPVNILSLQGVIALIGIMVNDGLVLIGKFNNNLKQNFSFNDGLIDAGKSRFRAIFLTTATTVAGLTPLLLEKSRQAQWLKPMAISISYGIAFATILTLILLPIFISLR